MPSVARRRATSRGEIAGEHAARGVCATDRNARPRATARADDARARATKRVIVGRVFV